MELVYNDRYTIKPYNDKMHGIYIINRQNEEEAVIIDHCPSDLIKWLDKLYEGKKGR